MAAVSVATLASFAGFAPAAAQLDPEALDRFVRQGLEAWNVAGAAVGVVSGDELILARGWGVRDVRTGEPVTPETLFAIGSNTKLMTAVAAGMMVDDGRMEWDDRAVEHLPGLRLHDPWVTAEIRIRDLLSHRSGLGRRGDMLWYASPWDRAEVLRRIRFLEPNTSFRSAYGYQNVMFLAAGEAVAAAAGRSWDAVVRERIFQPLGMETANTSTRELAGAVDVATPHLLVDGEPVPVAWRNLDNVAPAGSVNASVQDMGRWLRFLLGGGTFQGRELLDSATLREITSPQTLMPFARDTLFPTTHFAAYGLGVAMRDQEGVKVLLHTGGIDGMLSTVLFVPERDLGVVVLTNTSGPTQLHMTIALHVLDGWLGRAATDWNDAFLSRTRRALAAAEEARARAREALPAGTRPSLALGGYAGTYRSELYGDVGVRAGGDGLRVHFGPDLVGDLVHAHLDTFEARWDDPAAGETRITFHLDVRGRAAALEAEGLGRFERVDEGGDR